MEFLGIAVAIASLAHAANLLTLHRYDVQGFEKVMSGLFFGLSAVAAAGISVALFASASGAIFRWGVAFFILQAIVLWTVAGRAAWKSFRG